MWSAASRYRFMMSLTQYCEGPACVGAYACACRAAACESAYVLELHPAHPGHRGYVCVFRFGTAFWTFAPGRFPYVPRAAVRRVALWVSRFLAWESVAAYAAVSRVGLRDHGFILGQCVRNPAHRGGLLWPRRRLLSAWQAWALGGAVVGRGSVEALRGILACAGADECARLRRVRPRFS